jgi:ribonucleoside-diphosphate reductase alpha chain
MKQIINSKFVPSQLALRILKQGRILQLNESPTQMVERVVRAIVNTEAIYPVSVKEMKSFARELTDLIDQRKVIFSTPVMTNAGTNSGRPLSACTVPPISLREDISKIKRMVDTYHQEGLGTGFNFDSLDDPLPMLYFLNEVAVNGASSGQEDRPVGNMGMLSVNHPRIKEFICAKVNLDIAWKFNISVNVNDEFILAYRKNGKYPLSNGGEYYAKEVLDLIAAASFISGDPGIIFMDRLNYDNPVPELGDYQSIAPCAEVGLSPGESCQFGYLNLNGFFDISGNFDQLGLIQATRLLTRALDDALDVNIKNFQIKLSADITMAKRKIGIGVCGVADLLAKLKLGYDTEAGRKLIKDLILLINYISKEESFDLARVRGSFLAFPNSLYNSIPGFIERKYGQNDSKYVKAADWIKLADKIRHTGLRNCSTISLPPTGRSGLIIDASTGIEPFFNLLKNGKLHPELIADLKRLNLPLNGLEKSIIRSGGCQNVGLPPEIATVYKTATEIHPQDQLKMVAEIQQGVDESISKTINLPNQTSIDELKNILLDAHSAGLKGITVYINDRRSGQPIKLVD